MHVKNASLANALSCAKGSSVYEAAKSLKKARERHILVVDKHKPIGIISAVDIVSAVVAEGKDAKTVKVEDIMIAPVCSVNADDEIISAYFTMIGKNLFSCPVIEKDKLIGVLTLQEALKYIKEAHNARS